MGCRARAQADLLMGVFDGGALETRADDEPGGVPRLLRDPVGGHEAGVLERHVGYKFNRYMSIFGGEVVSTQLSSSRRRTAAGGPYTTSSTSPSATASGYVRASC